MLPKHVGRSSVVVSGELSSWRGSIDERWQALRFVYRLEDR
jgi:hypothetical protein